MDQEKSGAFRYYANVIDVEFRLHSNIRIFFAMIQKPEREMSMTAGL